MLQQSEKAGNRDASLHHTDTTDREREGGKKRGAGGEDGEKLSKLDKVERVNKERQNKRR